MSFRSPPMALVLGGSLLATTAAARPTPAAEPFRISTEAGPASAHEADAELSARKLRVQMSALETAPVLSVVAARPVVSASEAAAFHTFSNYTAFIDRAELRIFERSESPAGEPLTRIPAPLNGSVVWTPSASVARDYLVVLRVYDAGGRFDETAPQLLRFDPNAPRWTGQMRKGPMLEDQRRVANLAVSGAQLTVSGVAAPGETVTVDGEAVRPDEAGRFVVQQLVPAGRRQVRIVSEASGRAPFSIVREVEARKEDRFLVGIADLTVGRGRPGQGDGEQDGKVLRDSDDFAEGRLAFYYRGLDKGVRVTAAADTGEQPLAELFDRFGDKDPRSLLRRLDPDRHYPVYGDDSISVDDAPTSGRFYLRAETPTSEALWGDFHVDLGDTALLDYQRSLYGGRARYRSLDATAFGAARTEVKGFAADPGTAESREEFASTGGSVYFLRNPDLVVGSERLTVEIRDRDSGLVIERRELAPGRDYDVNYVQGRVILRQPLEIAAGRDGVVRVGGAGGDAVWLIATYEYSPGLSRPDNLTFGGRAQHWVGDSLRLGVSGYRQGDEAARQEVGEVDILLRRSDATYLRLEAAASEGAPSLAYVSAYGGYDFQSRQGPAGGGAAYLAEGALDLADLSSALQGRMSAYWRDREEGYSAPGELTFGLADQQFGGKFEVLLPAELKLAGKLDIASGSAGERSGGEVELRREAPSGWYGSLGLRHDDIQRSVGAIAPTAGVYAGEGARTDAAIEIGFRDEAWRAGERRGAWQAFGFVQGSLAVDPGRNANDRLGVGGEVRLTDRLSLRGEVSDGALGLGADARAELEVGDAGSVYLSYALSPEASESIYPVSLGRLGAGGRYRLSSQVSAFAESRYDHGRGSTGLSQSYGVDFTPVEQLRLGVRVEAGRLADPFSQPVERRAVSLSADYSLEALRMTSLVERRHENSVLRERATWATRNSLTWRASESARLFARADLSVSDAKNAPDVLNADFHEIVLGAAYRPAADDRFNALVKLSYLHDLPSPDQVDRLGQGLDFSQKSVISAVDLSYQITPRLELGAKVAHRFGELRAARDASAPWFGSRATFVAIRGDYRVLKSWDALIEVRGLSVDNPKEFRLGALVAAYKHVGDHLKIGVGFNFTDFSDDLSDLSYDEGGAFVNFVGKF